jgi:hypothetical protein
MASRHILADSCRPLPGNPLIGVLNGFPTITYPDQYGPAGIGRRAGPDRCPEQMMKVS